MIEHENKEEKRNKDRKSAIYGVLVVFVVVAIMVAGAWYFKIGGSGESISSRIAANTPADKAAVLRNDVYKFEITAPIGTLPQASFEKRNNLPDSWRYGAPTTGAGSQGVPLLAITVFNIEQQTASSTGNGTAEEVPENIYPLYYSAEVRIGVSSSTAACYKADYAGQKISSATIDGVAFKKFSFGDAAMMKYVQGESYRTIRDGLCYAIEQIKTGSSYKDETMKEGFSDEELDSYYKKAGDIIKTFHFLK